MALNPRKGTMLCCIGLLLIFTFVMSAEVQAEDGTSRLLRMSVVDAVGGPLADAEVAATDEAGVFIKAVQVSEEQFWVDGIGVKTIIELTHPDYGTEVVELMLPADESPYIKFVWDANGVSYRYLDSRGAPGGAGAGGGDCPGTDMHVQVEILTDNYGSETSWEIVQRDSGTVVASGGGYASNSLYVSDVFLDSTCCYDFTIFDSYGDGICCSYGEGYYNVYVNEALFCAGGDFGSFESCEGIGSNCGIAPPDCGNCEPSVCDVQVGITGGYVQACNDGQWVGFAFPIFTGGGEVNAVRATFGENTGVGSIYITGGTCDGPDVNNILATLCDVIQGAPEFQEVEYCFDPVMTSDVDPTWVVLVSHSGFAFAVAHDSTSYGTAGAGYGNLSGLGDPAEWVDLNNFGFGACYCVDLAVSECIPPTGACCYGDGSCAVVGPDECAAAGGAYMGTDTLCEDVYCGGACCFSDGSCTDGSYDDCMANGGVWQGLGTYCADTFCPVVGENDYCADAIAVEIGSVTPGSTVGATFDDVGTCGTSNTAAGVWYKVIGNGNTLVATTCENQPYGGYANYDTKISVFCGGCEVLTCVGGNDDESGCSFHSTVQFCSQYGAEYLILVHGFSSSEGDFGLAIGDTGNACTPDVLCLATGACCICIDGGSICEVMTEAQCAADGGVYLGDDTVCDEGSSIAYESFPGLSIPDDTAPGVSDTITIPDSFIIEDVNIDLGITHTWVGDLCVSVEHNGVVVQLIKRMGFDGECDANGCCGCSQNNLDIILDDEGAGGFIEDACSADLSSPPNYIPDEALAAFIGMDAAGDWIIYVNDNAGGDTGTLDSWSVHFPNPDAPDPCEGVCQIDLSMDIKPGSCPNSFNRGSNGVLPVALLGGEDFDIMSVDLSTVMLSRADGAGGMVGPHEGPPGPHSVYDDVATPFEGEDCDCHEMYGDGFMDLSMKFKTQDVVAALELDGEMPGSLVGLMLTGNLLDGTPFVAYDCIRLVPPGNGGSAMYIQAGADGFIGMSPLDYNLDGGGFGKFTRSYTVGNVVTLEAEPVVNGRKFTGWYVNGQYAGNRTTFIWVTSDPKTSIEARYGGTQDWRK